MSGYHERRRRLVVANWKMSLGRVEALTWIDQVLELGVAGPGIRVGVAPAFVFLREVADRVRDAKLEVLAQDCHPAANGPHTGSVSLAMLREAGANGVLVGHSERRREFGEGDELIRVKLMAALAAEFDAVLCVGETSEQRESQQTESVLKSQLGHALAGLSASSFRRLVVAYEPVWAIGTGRTATVPQAVAAMAVIRAILSEAGGEAGRLVPLLYGGSVTRENAALFFAETSVDGALVGGASLDPRHFADIVRAAGG